MSTLLETKPSEAITIRILRRLLLAIFVFGVIGAGVELVLLDHYEDLWQWTPLVLIAASLLVLGWHLAAGGRPSVRAFQIVMLLFVAGGLVGVVLHYQGNAEFELEMYPSLAGLDLFKESIQGATPALAPGTMIQLGLIGLAYTFRHPALAGAIEPSSIHLET
ncbi:MAG: hypothetical protein ACR2GR_00950 [Rhodothermales bacterium]